MANDRLTFEMYEQIRDEQADYLIAMDRTHIAVQCWLKRLGNKIDESQEPPLFLCLMWLLDNHIVQAFYRSYGIDVLPFAMGGMHGYGRRVGIDAGSCSRHDIKDLSYIATGSSCIDVRSSSLQSYGLKEDILAGKEPFKAIDYAALFAIGGKWPEPCLRDDCFHRRDAAVYLTVRQILTLLVVMGYAEDAILGTYVDCSDYGATTEPTHPLRVGGALSEPQFTMDYFSIELKKPRLHRRFWIHRRTGMLWQDAPVKGFAFDDWCGGRVDAGLEWILHNLAGDGKTL